MFSSKSIAKASAKLIDFSSNDKKFVRVTGYLLFQEL